MISLLVKFLNWWYGYKESSGIHVDAASHASFRPKKNRFDLTYYFQKQLFVKMYFNGVKDVPLYQLEFIRPQWKEMLVDFRYAITPKLAQKLRVEPRFAYQIGAIAFDASSQGGATSGTTKNVTHVCAASATLTAYCVENDLTGAAFTYNSVGMSLIGTGGSANYLDKIFYLGAPSSGSNTLAYSQTNTIGALDVIGVSLTGASNAADPTDGHAYGGGIVSPRTIVVTTGTANSMVIEFWKGFDNTSTQTESSGQTRIFQNLSNAVGNYIIEASYIAIASPAANSLSYTNDKVPKPYNNHSGIGILEGGAAAVANPHTTLLLMGVG